MQLIGNMYVPDGDHHFASFGCDLEKYQEPQRLKAFTYVKDWRCAVDLGAHIGIFSRHFAKVFDQVVSFEPTLATRECLEKNVPANVRIIPFACGDREGTVLFRRHIKNSGGSEVVLGDRESMSTAGIAPAKLKLRFEDCTAGMITLDSLKLDGVGLIKIDVQGCEPLVLRGGEDTIRRCRPVVLIEEKPLGGEAGSSAHIEASQSLLGELGYRAKERIGADRIYVAE